MALDDRLEYLGVARMVPNVIGPDDRDGPRLAYLQAIGLGPLDGPLAADQTKFLQPALEVVPRLLAFVAAAAFLLLGDAAQEDLPFGNGAAGLGQRLLGLAQGFRFCRQMYRGWLSCACPQSVQSRP